MTTLRKPHRNKSLDKYTWDKRSLNCFVCIGQAEVSRPRPGRTWVAMVPRSTDDAGGKSWSLMPDSEGIKSFRSAKEAMEAVEAYLDVFNQYHQPYSGGSIDMSEGNIGVAGAQA